MSWNDDYSHGAHQNAADLANSFLNSVGQELGQGYGDGSMSHKGSDGYAGDSAYQRNDDHYREKSHYRDDGYHRSDSHRRHSRDRYRDRSRDRDSRRRHGRSRERRDRSRDRHYKRSSRDDRGRDDRDYRRSRRSSPDSRRSRRSRSSSYRRDDSIVPLHKRERKLNNWDMPPPGMEGMTAMQVKQTGLFPLPGQVVGTRTPQSFAPPSEHAMYADPTRLRVSQGAAGPVAVNATLARQARRLYVGQIPFGIEESAMADFFNSTMQQMKLADAPSVVAVQINHDKSYAFVEFQTPEQATAAMAFDNIMFQGQSLKIRRPKDYQPVSEYAEQMAYHDVSNMVPDTPNKIFVGGLPTYLTEDQVVELLTSFGELRAFNLVKDPATGQSKGFAFCEYADPSVTDLACQGLNNMELGDKRLVVQRASVGARQGPLDTPFAFATPIVPLGVVKDEDATKVLQLLNMVTPEELENDEEYQDIWDDIAEECTKFGTVVDMKIPRPEAGKTVNGVGKIFVRFQTPEESLKALRSLAGRKFADRTVVATFADESNYLADAF